MQSESRETLLNTKLKGLLVFLMVVVIFSLVLFRGMTFVGIDIFWFDSSIHC